METNSAGVGASQDLDGLEAPTAAMRLPDKFLWQVALKFVRQDPEFQ